MPIEALTSNKGTFRRLHDVTNSSDTELISKTIDEIFMPDVRIRTPLPVQATGAQALKDVFAILLHAYPDLHVTVEDLIEEGDKVVGRNSIRGTHLGEYMGLQPTGRPVTYDEIMILRFVKGRIAETWGSSTSSHRCGSLAPLGTRATPAPRSPDQATTSRPAAADRYWTVSDGDQELRSSLGSAAEKCAAALEAVGFVAAVSFHDAA